MTDITPYRGKRALVCGGLDYEDGMTVSRVLDSLDPSMVIEGGARGAGRLAATWWDARRRTPETYAPRPVDVTRWGYARACTMRNARMLAEGRPDYVLTFPGGRGTEDMVSKAKAAGVPVLRVRRDGSVEVMDRKPRLVEWAHIRAREREKGYHVFRLILWRLWLGLAFTKWQMDVLVGPSDWTLQIAFGLPFERPNTFRRAHGDQTWFRAGFLCFAVSLFVDRKDVSRG